MEHPTYTAYLWMTLRRHGIKRALRVVWLMETYGIIKGRMIALGLGLVIAGLFLARWYGIDLGYLIAMAGAFVVGFNDGRMCVCDDCECNDPRMIFDTDEDEDEDETDPDDKGYRLVA